MSPNIPEHLTEIELEDFAAAILPIIKTQGGRELQFITVERLRDGLVIATRVRDILASFKGDARLSYLSLKDLPGLDISSQYTANRTDENIIWKDTYEYGDDGIRFQVGAHGWSNPIPLTVYSLATADAEGLMSPSQFNKLRASVPSFDALPDSDDYPTGQIILVDGKFYRNYSTAIPNAIAGVIGRLNDGAITSYGTHAGDGLFAPMGQWTSNPNRVVSWLISDSQNAVSFAIRRDSYRAAKGSNEANGDELTLSVTVGNTTQDVTVIHAGVQATAVSDDGIVYLLFIGSAPSNFVLRTASSGTPFSFLIKQGGSEFITHPGSLGHWNLYPLASDSHELSSRVTVGGSFPENPLRGSLHLFDAAASSLTGAVDTDGATAKTDATAFDLFKYNGTAWQYVGFIGDDVTTALRLETDDTLVLTRRIGALLSVNLARLRHIHLINVFLESGNDLSTEGIDNHAEDYGDADQYEFRSPILNTGPMRLRVSYTVGGQLNRLAYKPVLDIHGHALVAGAIQVNELVAVRFDTELDAWISNVYPVATATQPGLMSAYEFTKLRKSVASFESLPNAADYEVGQLIVVDNRFYKNYETPAADAIAGLVGQVNFPSGDHLRGVHSGDGIFTPLGQWTSNPNAAVSWVTVDDGHQISFAIKRSVYRAEKGSNEADGDQLTLAITVDDTTESTTVTVRPSNSRTVTNNYGDVFLVFVGTVSSDFILSTADFGAAFTLFVGRGGTNFLTHLEGLRHWNAYPLSADRQQLPPEFTVGSSFPPNPWVNDLHLFDVAKSSLTGAVGRDGTTGQATARAFDLFKFNGRDWQLVGFIGDTDTVGGGGGAGISIGGSFPSEPSNGTVHLFNAPATGLTGAVSADGLTVKTTAQALDLFRYNGTNWVYVGFIGDAEGIMPFDSLPDASDYQNGQLILVGGKFYRNYNTPTANTINGVLGDATAAGDSIRGTHAGDGIFGALGQWTSNPNRVVSFVIDNVFTDELILGIRRDSYRAAKGSNEANGDQLTLEITVGNTTQSVTTTIRNDDGRVVTASDGTAYLVFEGDTTSSFVFRTASAGDAFSFLIKRGGNDFITHAAELPHWNVYPLEADQRQLPPQYTIGGSFPANPSKNDVHQFNVEASSLTGAVDTDGSTAKTSARALDQFKFNGTAWQYIGFLGDTQGVIPFDSLPDASDYANGQLIVVNGAFYKNYNTPEANTINGVLGDSTAAGDRIRGTHAGDGIFGALGQWTSNPNRVVSWLIDDIDNNDLVFAIRRDSYRTAKGSNEATGDQLTLEVTVGNTTQSVTVTIRGGDDRVVTASDGTAYLVFEGGTTSSFAFRTASAGDAFSFLIKRGGADFITHAAELPHWNVYPLEADRQQPSDPDDSTTTGADSPYAIFSLDSGRALAAVGSTPNALRVGATPTRQHNAAGVIDRANNTQITLQPGTYEITNHVVVDPTTSNTGSSRANFRIQLYDGTNVLDDKRYIGYIRAVDVDPESFDSHHIITVTTETNLRVRVGIDTAGGGVASVATAAGGTVMIRMIGSAVQVTAEAPTDAVQSDEIDEMVKLTQTAFDAIQTPNPRILYAIVG